MWHDDGYSSKFINGNGAYLVTILSSSVFDRIKNNYFWHIENLFTAQRWSKQIRCLIESARPRAMETRSLWKVNLTCRVQFTLDSVSFVFTLAPWKNMNPTSSIHVLRKRADYALLPRGKNHIWKWKLRILNRSEELGSVRLCGLRQTPDSYSCTKCSASENPMGYAATFCFL